MKMAARHKNRIKGNKCQGKRCKNVRMEKMEYKLPQAGNFVHEDLFHLFEAWPPGFNKLMNNSA